MEKYDQKKVWILGNEIKGITNNFSWATTSIPSFSECEVLIVDTTTLDESILKSLSFDNTKRLFDEILKRIKTGFTIICIVSKNIQGVTQKDSSIITNYFWCPFAFHFDEVPPSKSIKPINKFLFENYLKKTKELKIALKFQSHAKNHCQDDISIVGTVSRPILVKELIQNNSNDIFGGIFYYIYNQLPSGDVVMLPPLEDSEKSIQAILEELGINVETPPPQWVEKFSVPGTDRINGEIQEKNNLIKKTIKEIGELDLKRKNLEKFQKLLYASDKELENIVKESLSLIGISNIQEGRSSELEDLIFDFKHEKLDKCVIEVKSSTKLIKLDDLRQADNWSWDYQNKGKKVKTLVIANTYRLDNPESSKKHREDFNTFGEFCQKHEICILPTLTLFELVRSKLEGKEIDRKKFESVINNSNGVATNKDFK